MSIESSFSSATAAEPNKRAREEQVRAVLFTEVVQQSPALFIPALLGALAVVGMMWDKVNHPLLLAWLTVMLLNLAFGFAVRRAYLATQPSWAKALRFRILFPLGALWSGMMWAVAVFIMFVADSWAYQAILWLVLFAAAAGGSTLSPRHLPTFFCYAIPVMIAPIIRSAMEGDALHLLVAGVGLLFSVSVVFFAINVNKLAKQSVQIRYENIDLIEELKAQKEAADKANRAKSQFLAAASHDLRQPLHALGLFAGALEAKIQYPEVRRIVGNINASVQALESLFNELLDVSKLDAGVILPAYSNFPLQQMFDRIATDFGPIAAEHNLKFAVVPTRVVLFSDPTLLERMLRNLVANAMRYTHRGGVVLGVRRRAGKASIEVCDTGIGIPTELREKIFEEFYQIGNPERDRTKGLGLGLAIVRRLSELLQHRLELTSRPGKGSIFRIEIGIGKLDMEQPTTHREATEAEDALVGKYLVLIDDESAVRESMEVLFHEWACETVLAGSLEEAEARLIINGRPPDVIIADYRLRDGATGAQAIRALQEKYGGEIPGLLITGDTAPDRLLEARESGNYLLHKPVPPPRLKAVVSYLIEQRGRRERASA